jgi:hypothetical protein
MTEALAPGALERWKVNPTSFIFEVLRNPKTGKSFELFDAQKQWFEHCWQLRDDGRLLYPEQCIGWIKKTGKTATAAMHVFTTLLVYGGKYAEGYCVGSDLQQAQERVFGEIKRIIEASPLLKREAVITQNRISFPQTSATIQAISTDASGAAGAHPTIVSVDEAWTIDDERGRRLWDELIPVPTQQISCRLVTTHAGYANESTLLEELCTRGTNLPEIAPNLHGGDGMLFTWRHEPLAPWQTEQWLQEMRKLTRPLQFKRQFENYSVSNEAHFVTGEEWDAVTTLSAPPATNPMLPVFIGVDASVKRDSTAIVVVNGEKDGVRLVDHKIIIPSSEHPIDFEVIETILLDYKKKHPLCTIVFDISQLAYLAQRLAKTGLKVEEFVQSPANISAMTQNLYDLIRGRKLMVYPNQRLRTAVINALVTENSTGQQRFSKNKDQKTFIDVVVALAMAALRCVQRHQLAVDLSHKYRAFDPNFRDEDLPPMPPDRQPSAAQANLVDLYRSIEIASGGPSQPAPVLWPAPPKKFWPW